MTEYLAETVNPEYSDMVARVKFASGKAILSEEVASGTDRDLPELIRVFEDLGITITEVFRCEKCGEMFKSQKAVAGHMKKHRRKEVKDGRLDE